MDCPGVVFPTASTPTECVLKGVVGLNFIYRWAKYCVKTKNWLILKNILSNCFDTKVPPYVARL